MASMGRFAGAARLSMATTMGRNAGSRCYGLGRQTTWRPPEFCCEVKHHG
jgi:hypothetical protein